MVGEQSADGRDQAQLLALFDYNGQIVSVTEEEIRILDQELKVVQSDKFASSILEVRQSGDYLLLSDTENALILVDLRVPAQRQKISGEDEIRCFTIYQNQGEEPFIAVIPWNSKTCQFYRGIKALFSIEITDPFDQSIQGCEFLSFVEAKSSQPICFFTVSLSSGYYLTWTFYPEIYNKLQALNQSEEFFKSAIM